VSREERTIGIASRQFAHGFRPAWLIDQQSDRRASSFGGFLPKKRTARVFSTVEKSVLIRADQALDGGDVLPGFVLRLSDPLDRGRRPRRG
jgi:hypothetical protein